MKKILLLLTIFSCCACDAKPKCPSDFKLQGNKCVKQKFISATKNTTYYCNDSIYNETLEGDECVYYVNVPATSFSNCPTYYREYGSRCKFMFGRRTSNCSYDEIQWGNQCYKEYLSNNVTYYCTVGTLQGTMCVNKYSYKAFEKTEYSCPPGYEYISEYALCSTTVYRIPT